MGENLGYSRRDFLKIVGATGSLVATGCGKKASEKLYPYVVQPDEIIPGIASWYASSCGECSAGCGILVKTREGRAIKIEGNPNHPVNRGGLCARGQSALQTLYDPDRIREPLQRGVDQILKPVPWADAVSGVAKAFSDRPTDAKAAGSKAVILTQPLSGSQAKLVAEFAAKVPNVEHIEYDLFNHDLLDVAAETTWGAGYRVHYDLEQADVILSVGADYLETWLSPVEFARAWAAGRKTDGSRSASYCAHIAPRLSLTAGNADEWIQNSPGSEVWVLLALLRGVLDAGGGKGLSVAERQMLSKLVQGVEIERIAAFSDVRRGTLEQLAKVLVSARAPVVLVGGTSISGPDAVASTVLGNLLNTVLGSVGRTLLLRKRERASAAEFSLRKVKRLIDEMNDGKIGVLLLSGTNPAFTLSPESKFAEAVAKVGTVVAASTLLDETTLLANFVLPLSTSLESWGDSEPAPAVHSLVQPTMQPLYQTQGLMDSLIAVAAKLNILFGEAANGYDYIRAQWKQRSGDLGFETHWLKNVERGGDWTAADISVTSAVLSDSVAKLALPVLQEKARDLMLLAYPTVHLFDGSPANRPWLQELPDPLTNVVWGSWVEMHPETALGLGIKAGDTARVRTAHGTIEAAVYITEYVHPRIIAVPIGQGHSNLGRYSVGVGVNPLGLLPFPKDGDASFTMSLADGSVTRALFQDRLIQTQGHFSQEKRDQIRSINVSELAALSASAVATHTEGAAHDSVDKSNHGSHSADGGHESAHHGEPRFGPAPADRPNMYKQMEHPLYRWAMTVDLASCTGCSACVVACYAENNVPVVGKDLCEQGREMSWIRIDRYFDGPKTQPVSGFMPMMCQHCGNAPCEPVCPVYATYHNEEGLNTMVYNRCVGTRYCSNNCTYKVRRFNWFKYQVPEPLTWQLNPDVAVREVGVMEKCSFCVQRIQAAENNAKNLGRSVADGEIQPACASSCPTGAITFGNLLDQKSAVYRKSQSERGYRVLDEAVNSQPAVTYLARIRNDKVKVA